MNDQAKILTSKMEKREFLEKKQMKGDDGASQDKGGCNEDMMKMARPNSQRATDGWSINRHKPMKEETVLALNFL